MPGWGWILIGFSALFATLALLFISIALLGLKPAIADLIAAYAARVRSQAEIPERRRGPPTWRKLLNRFSKD